MDPTGSSTESFSRKLGESDRQFRAEVFPAELGEVARSRAVRNLPPVPTEGSPSTQKDLTGLAFSGGGVRSASVSIGVLQALVSTGAFRHVDYLSTVSGGGYAGSCVSSILNEPETTAELFRETPGEQDTVVIRHLRNCANYLSSRGPGSRMRMPMVIFRGIITNLLLAIPLLILAVLVTEVVIEAWHLAGGFGVNPLTAAGLILIPLILHPTLMRVLRMHLGWRARNTYELVLARLLTASLAFVSFLPVWWLVDLCVDRISLHDLRRYFDSRSFEHAALMGGVVVVLISLFKLSSHWLGLSRGARMVSRWAVGIMGPLLFFAVYLLCCIAFVESPYLDPKYRPLLKTLSNPGAATISEAQIAQLREMLDGKGFELGSSSFSFSKTAKGWTIQYTPVGSPGTISPLIQVEILDQKHGLRIPQLSVFNGHANWPFYLTGLGIFLLNLLAVDVNLTSSHGFYRDRLSKAFLLRRTHDGSLVQNDDQKLSDLNAPGTSAPYHLINTTLNLPASADPNLRGRQSDFFTFSKLYTGGNHTGYVSTRKIEARDPAINLGTAMAISAAAAAPNMGIATQKFLVFILTILNIRLGYWAPNPRTLRDKQPGVLRRWLFPTVGPSYLWKEAVGDLDARRRHVNLSDGGHLENLAIYQLLKRRCRWIIAVDAEADPSQSFQGMVTLLRFARIDLGISIDLRFEEIRKDEHGLSRSHWALGSIDYGEGSEKGYLLYLKSSMTGDENEYLRAFSREDPCFPHTPTSNQFFDETEFEVYRALGQHIALNALSDPRVIELFPWLNREPVG